MKKHRKVNLAIFHRRFTSLDFSLFILKSMHPGQNFRALAMDFNRWVQSSKHLNMLGAWFLSWVNNIRLNSKVSKNPWVQMNPLNPPLRGPWIWWHKSPIKMTKLTFLCFLLTNDIFTYVKAKLMVSKSWTSKVVSILYVCLF